jgi:thiol-disulfide isomerase/thioredoxin
MGSKILAVLFSTIVFAGECAAARDLGVAAADSREATDSGYTIVRVKMEDTAGYSMRFYPAVTETHTTDKGYVIYTCKIPYDERCVFVLRNPAFKIVPQKGIIFPPQLELFLKKGTSITIEGNAKTPAMSRVRSSDKDVQEFEVFRAKASSIDNELWLANSRELILKTQQDTAGVAVMEKKIKEIIQKRNHWEMDFVKAYPHSRAALQIFVLYYQRLDSQEAWDIFRKFPDSLKTEGAGASIAGFFDSLHHTDAGNPVIPFKQEGIDGKVVDIESLKGKVVVIDFWGSWCGPCRRSHPHLKALYNKYHDKGLEIIGIAYEGGTPQGKDSIWRKAVKEDGITWLQILNDPDGTDLTKLYSVTAFPTKIIVDREGKIVFRVSDSFSEEFDRKLAGLFK